MHACYGDEVERLERSISWTSLGNALSTLVVPVEPLHPSVWDEQARTDPTLVEVLDIDQKLKLN